MSRHRGFVCYGNGVFADCDWCGRGDWKEAVTDGCCWDCWIERLHACLQQAAERR